MKNLGEKTFVFLIGAFVYSFMEVSARGFTHWSMTLTGGVILVILYSIYNHIANIPLWKRCILGSVIITAVEFGVGVLVNIKLDWYVWDYSNMPLNFMGQICLPFTTLWFFISVPAYGICKIIRNRFSDYYEQPA